MEFNSSDEVTVRCNKCGIEYCFFPMRVIVMLTCKCGNDDCGSVKDWFKGKFGNFTFVKKQEVIYTIQTPFGIMKI